MLDFGGRSSARNPLRKIETPVAPATEMQSSREHILPSFPISYTHPHHFIIKMADVNILVTGASGVGKSSYINRFTTAIFPLVGEPTMSIIDDITHRRIVFTEDIHTTLPLTGIILMTDATELPTVASVVSSYTELRTMFPAKPIVVAANKIEKRSQIDTRALSAFQAGLMAALPFASFTTVSARACLNWEVPVRTIMAY